MTSEVGSFAQSTMRHRKPRIIEEVIVSNNYSNLIVERLILLEEEILREKIRPLTERASDVELWNKAWRKFEHKTWLELPWYFAEAYFYRRLLEAIEYFQPGPLHNLDPFELSKRSQLKESIEPLSIALEAIETVDDPRLCFENLLHASLWGNRVDLSNLTVTDEVRRRQAMIERENLLIDDFPKVFEIFVDGSLSNVAFINDNAGMELGFDLFLSDFLLQNGWVDKITHYLKPYPFFVSDAMVKDLQETLNAFINASNPCLTRLGKRMQEALSDGTLCTSADWFWASSYHFCEMPKELCEELSRLDMVILKGDVNYRRLLSDRHWPHNKPIEEIVDYFPTSLLILRTLKGEIIVSLKKDQAEKVEAEDPNWLTNGVRGIIQCVKRVPQDG